MEPETRCGRLKTGWHQRATTVLIEIVEKEPGLVFELSSGLLSSPLKVVRFDDRVAPAARRFGQLAEALFIQPVRDGVPVGRFDAVKIGFGVDLDQAV